MFIDLATAKRHLNIVGDDDDVHLALLASAAEQSALAYLNRKVYEDRATLDAAVLAMAAGIDPMVVNDAIRVAMLLILGNLYANREDVVVGASVARLPGGSRALLDDFRRGPGL